MSVQSTMPDGAVDDYEEVRSALGLDAEIRLDALRLDGGTQPRAVLSETVIADYAEDMARGDHFPPVDVFYDGADYWLADGFHRVHAAKRAGMQTIPAAIRQGTRRDAVLFSAGVNRAHGFRRSNADKRRQVVILLEDPEWRQWSDSEIGKRCGVSQPFVGKLRAELAATYNDYKSPEVRQGADGRAINTTQIGGRSAGRPARRDSNAEAVFGSGAALPRHDPALRPDPAARPTPRYVTPADGVDEPARVETNAVIYDGRVKLETDNVRQAVVRFLDGEPNWREGRVYEVTIRETGRG